jgi:hypothetical protein
LVIFRRFVHELDYNEETPGIIRPAFQVFLEAEGQQTAPKAVILQAEHAKLAGEIARHLRKEVFGELPREVLEAIAEHDLGWAGSDQAQLDANARQPMRPFPRLLVEEIVPPWKESVRRAEASSALKGVLVSRHFCALAATDPARRPFAEEENPRRQCIESQLGAKAQDLDRWTAAMGFCDVVSLYLCCGSQEPVEVALAHPALPQGREAKCVFLEWVGGEPRFSSPIVKEGANVSVRALEPGAAGSEMRDTVIEWVFLQ